MKDICKQFHQGMKLTRAKKGISLVELSKKTKISLSHLSHLENGESSPTLNMVVRICKGLGVSTNELFKNGDF